jgi:hypothetical protein
MFWLWQHDCYMMKYDNVFDDPEMAAINSILEDIEKIEQERKAHE